MLAPFSKGQTAAVHQCSGSSGKWRLARTSLSSGVVLKQDVSFCNREANFMKTKQSKFHRRSSFNLKRKAVVGHLFSQWTVLTATAWDSIGKSDGVGLNFTCSWVLLGCLFVTLCTANCLVQQLAFGKLSGRCMRSVKGPAPLCLDAFVPLNQIASQALLECNSKYAAGQKGLLSHGPRVWTWNLWLKLRVTLHISCLLLQVNLPPLSCRMWSRFGLFVLSLLLTPNFEETYKKILPLGTVSNQVIKSWWAFIWYTSETSKPSELSL